MFFLLWIQWKECLGGKGKTCQMAGITEHAVSDCDTGGLKRDSQLFAFILIKPLKSQPCSKMTPKDGSWPGCPWNAWMGWWAFRPSSSVWTMRVWPCARLPQVCQVPKPWGLTLNNNPSKRNKESLKIFPRSFQMSRMLVQMYCWCNVIGSGNFVPSGDCCHCL